MKINGEEYEFASGISIYEMIEGFKLDPEMVAVEMNGVICSRDQWADVILKKDDRIELIRFVGGG